MYLRTLVGRIRLARSFSQQALSIDAVSIFEKNAPSCVSVFSGDSQGSGFVWRPGYVVTCCHVVDNPCDCAVLVNPSNNKILSFRTQKLHEAKVIGASRVHDVALLHVESMTNNISPIEMGDSENLGEGQKIYMIGDPGAVLDHWKMLYNLMLPSMGVPVVGPF